MGKIIGVLTGGGDVPGLNPCIKAVVMGALEQGYQVYGINLTFCSDNFQQMRN